MLWVCHHKILEKIKKKLKIKNSGPMSQYDYQQLYLRKGGVKGPVTLEPPCNFSELYQSGIVLAG